MRREIEPAGDLAGQQDWMTSHSDIFTVDPTGEGKVTAVGTWRQAWHSGAGIQLDVGESITMQTEFQLTGTDLATPPTGGVNMLRTGLYMYDTDTEAWTTFNLVTFGTGAGGDFWVRNHGNLPPTGTLGPYADHYDSRFMLEYTLTMGTLATNSTVSYRVFDLTKDMVSTTAIYTGIATNQYVHLLAGTAFPYIGTTAYTANDSKIEGIEFFSTTIIPEPASGAMILFGLLGLVAVRRYRAASPT